MKPILKIKIAVDAAMSSSMLLLMAYGLVGEAAHEWIGMGMFALFVAHHILNRRWIQAVPQGRYTPQRSVQTALAGTVTVLALTIAIYATFFHDFLGQFLELSPETITLISRDPVNVGTMLMANVAHGFLIATVILWGKFFKPLQGAKAAAVIALLTEIYFCFSQYSIMKTMSIQSAIIDTIMWTLVNFVVGAVTAKILSLQNKQNP